VRRKKNEDAGAMDYGRIRWVARFASSIMPNWRYRHLSASGGNPISSMDELHKIRVPGPQDRKLFLIKMARHFARVEPVLSDLR